MLEPDQARHAVEELRARQGHLEEENERLRQSDAEQTLSCKRFEQELQETEAFNVSVRDSLIEHIAVLDADGTILSVNHSWRRFGQSNGAPESVANGVGLNYLDICAKAVGRPNGDEAEAALQGIQSVLAGTQGEFMLEYPCHSPTGYRWFRMHVTPLKGPVAGVVVAHIDITLPKHTQLRDQWRNRILESLATGTSLPSILELITLSVEAEDPSSLCSILLLDSEGKRLLQGAAPSLPSFLTEAIHGVEIGIGVGSCGTAAFIGKRVVAEDIFTHPYWVAHQDLARRAHLRSCWSEPIFSPTGRVLGTFAIYRHEPSVPTNEQVQLIKDAASLASISIEHKRAMEALEQAKESAEAANRAKDQFIAVLSHELRTPLTPVLATVSTLEAQDDLPDHIRSDLELIHRNIEMEATLIDDLLDVTRISRGKVELHIEVVDVHSFLRTVQEICQPDIDAKQLEVVDELQAAHHHVLADAARLSQAFWNLLRNAVKFTPESGRIILRTSNWDGQLRIEISDSGVGISPEVMPRIFNLFEQGERSKSRRFGGLGLGLNIARTVIEMHHGRLNAFSGGTNQGSTFTVELSVVPEARAAESTRSAPAEHPAIQHSNILLVEDHPDTVQVLSRLLRKWGHTVTNAGNVRKALELAAGQHFDLLVSDLGLPDGSGLDVMRDVKSRQEIPGIALSGYGTEEDVRESREAGFREHLTKPINAQTLQAAIERSLVSAA